MGDGREWRVVSTAGELVPVRVWVGACDCGCKQSPTWVQVDGWTTYGVNRDGEAPQRAVRQKIGEVFPCAEIRAPGEMTTAERVAAAVRDGMHRGFALAQEHAVAVADGDDGAPTIDWTDAIAALGDALARGGA